MGLVLATKHVQSIQHLTWVLVAGWLHEYEHRSVIDPCPDVVAAVRLIAKRTGEAHPGASDRDDEQAKTHDKSKLKHAQLTPTPTKKALGHPRKK